MEILDEDMQMVRDFLTQGNAPEYVKGHFENLVAEHTKEADRAADTKAELDSKRDDDNAALDRTQKELDDLQDRFDEISNCSMESALLAVKYWMVDVLVHHKPMTDPRKILRIVEDAL